VLTRLSLAAKNFSTLQFPAPGHWTMEVCTGSAAILLMSFVTERATRSGSSADPCRRMNLSHRSAAGRARGARGYRCPMSSVPYPILRVSYARSHP